MILIREMRSEDLAFVSKIEEQSFTHPWTKEQFQSELNTAHAWSYVALYNKMIVGYIVFWNVYDEIEIGVIAVLETHRNKQIGQRLLHTAIAQKPISIFLEVSDKNDVAQTFYISQGFQEIHRRRSYYKDGTDAIIMKKSF